MPKIKLPVAPDVPHPEEPVTLGASTTTPEDRSTSMGRAALLGILLVFPVVALLLLLQARVRGPAAIGAGLDALLERPAVGLALHEDQVPRFTGFFQAFQSIGNDLA